jgi:hypothetical protein
VPSLPANSDASQTRAGRSLEAVGGNACSAGSAHAVNVVFVVVWTVEVDDETQVGHIEAARCNGRAYEHVDDAGFEIPRAGSRGSKRRTRKRRT